MKTKIFLVLVSGAVCLVLSSNVAPADNLVPRVVEVIADSDNTFRIPSQKKPTITAKPGELLDLRITSKKGEEQARDGAVHSFVIKKLRNQGWDIRLMPGTHDYKVTAPGHPGEYLVECTVKCGRGHDDMNMKLIVRQ